MEMEVIEEKGNEVKIEIGLCEHVWVNTPRGQIKLFVGKSYTSITSWVEDADYSGFYKNKTVKKTTGSALDGTKHVRLYPKDD